jgi:uncharacterized protein YciW
MSADLIDSLAGISEDSPLGQLRRQRADIFRHTQGSHDVLVTPADPGGVSLAERAAIALIVAEYDDDTVLAAHYRALVEKAGGIPQGERWDALLVHTDLLAGSPGAATSAHLRKLEAVGLSARDIVAVSQLIAFVSYQVRLMAGLRLLKQEA